jgi:hypothetical protein
MNKTPVEFKLYEGGDQIFRKACTLADVKPTRRQYRRWTQERGQAYAKRAEAIKS